MDSLGTAINLMNRNCYFGSIDLKDAFFSIPVRESDRKFLRFTWNGELYQFTCLAQGLSTCPRVFTKIMKCVFSELRKKGHCNSAYIDDSLLIGQSYEDCINNINDTVTLFDKLGLTIHPNKSVFVPTQEIQHLGFVLNSREMSVRLTQEKSQKFKELCKQILRKEYVSIREFSELIGKMVASEYGVPYAKLFHKRLHITKNEQLRKQRGNYDAKFGLNEMCKQDINWWIDNIEICKKYVCIGNPEIIIRSDASLTGWGGVYESQSTGGRWSAEENSYHINQLELLAVYLTLKSFCSNASCVHIHAQIDNTTAVTYINKMGGMKENLNDLTREILLWCINRNIWLTAAHLPGSENCEADYESRNSNDDTEWELDSEVYIKIEQLFGSPDIDLFASRLNYKVTPYCSYRPDPNAKLVDAFTFNWGTNFNYIFPPFSILGAVLRKIVQDQADAIVIAPLWPTQPWFPKILQLLVDCPRILPVKKSLVTLSFNKTKVHPLLNKLHLTAFKLSGDHLKVKVYQNQLSTLSCIHGETPQNNNIGVISKSGCVFVLKNMLIPCHQL
ncbi:uncharacterized protein LOC134694218 [Mytilus trossulus]|uniref:uncharacterized protein LOC134694218 n=1 Tax=Mytilus trossulus TaxID=6551 RepID=UPI0030076D09